MERILSSVPGEDGSTDGNTLSGVNLAACEDNQGNALSIRLQ